MRYYSDCCGAAQPKENSTVCPSCKENCEFITEAELDHKNLEEERRHEWKQEAKDETPTLESGSLDEG